MKTRLLIWCSALLIAGPTLTAADKGRATGNKPAPILIEAEQLQKKLNDVLIAC